MLYVDFFWTFAIGAMFAGSAARQIKRSEDPFVNIHFLVLVLYMAIFFGGTGMVLLWNFPHWETMQVYWIHGDIPLWFVLLWFVTNVTNPILAYAWCVRLIKRDKAYEATLLSVAGYVLFFFVLFYGWDGTGWQRFFYDATVTGVPWRQYPARTLGLAWFGAPVALTLYALGLVFLPPHFYFCTKWATAGLREDPATKDSVPSEGLGPHLQVALAALAEVGVALGIALGAGGVGWLLAAAGADPLVGAFVGPPAAGAVAYVFLLRRGKPLHALFRATFKMD
ncbi:MAG: hypothetical protein Kow0069_27860 [Promethearchaeota archaeon]